MAKRKRALLLYVAVAYGITWSVWLPYVHAASVSAPLPNPFLYYVAAAGPFIAAVGGDSCCRDSRSTGAPCWRR
jgi:hypothetical protein